MSIAGLPALHAKFSLTFRSPGLDSGHAESFCIFLRPLACPAPLLPGAGRRPAADRPSLPTPSRPDQAEERLDQLFADLKRERNEKAAERIAGQHLGGVVPIRQRLDRPDDAMVADRRWKHRNSTSRSISSTRW